MKLAETPGGKERPLAQVLVETDKIFRPYLNGDKGVAAYCSVFLVSGSLSLVQEWLQNGMDTPVPDLAKMLACLIMDALRIVWFVVTQRDFIISGRNTYQTLGSDVGRVIFTSSPEGMIR